VGRCEQAPVAIVGRKPIANATAEAVTAAAAAKDVECPVEKYIGYSEYRSGGGYRLAAGFAAGTRADPAAVPGIEWAISTLESSGLRGLGGAGFPAGRKLRIVRSEPAPRFLAVNIDEGEPGTFKCCRGGSRLHLPA
jgi:formate dehydrogenase